MHIWYMLGESMFHPILNMKTNSITNLNPTVDQWIFELDLFPCFSYIHTRNDTLHSEFLRQVEYTIEMWTRLLWAYYGDCTLKNYSTHSHDIWDSILSHTELLYILILYVCIYFLTDSGIIYSNIPTNLHDLWRNCAYIYIVLDVSVHNVINCVIVTLYMFTEYKSIVILA